MENVGAVVLKGQKIFFRYFTELHYFWILFVTQSLFLSLTWKSANLRDFSTPYRVLPSV
jgi:hypothetical protein